MISTGEQDGWAYVATGSETYALWERHRQRQWEYAKEIDKRTPSPQLLTELHHAHKVQRQVRG